MNASMRFRVAASHPALPGHFPGRPIVPGVVLIDFVVRAIEAERGAPLTAWTLGAAKFLRPVGPDVDLVVECRDDAQGAIRFAISHGDLRIATGVLHPDLRA